MKKLFIVLGIISFIVLVYTRKMENGSGFLPLGSTYSYSECHGYYLETYNRTASDGPRGGFCFGFITEETITTENPCGEECTKKSEQNREQNIRYAQ